MVTNKCSWKKETYNAGKTIYFKLKPNSSNGYADKQVSVSDMSVRFPGIKKKQYSVSFAEDGYSSKSDYYVFNSKTEALKKARAYMKKTC